MSWKVIFVCLLILLVLSFDECSAKKRRGSRRQLWKGRKNKPKVTRPKITIHKPSLYFIISSGIRNGPFAVLEETRDPQSTYRLLRPCPYITIDQRTGVLKWIRPHRQSRHRQKLQNLPLQVAVTKGSRSRIININIIILPQFYGSWQLSNYLELKKSVRLLQPDNIFSGSVISPGSLHRFLRKLRDKMYSKGFKEAMSSMSAEKSLKVMEGHVVTKVVKILALTPGDSIKGIFLPWATLFSKIALQRLRTKSECQNIPPATISCRCVSKSFRTIDGTCNNLQRPFYGSAPNVLQRLLPAKYYDLYGLHDPLGFPYQLLAPKVPSPFDIAKSFIVGHSKQLRSQSKFSHAVMQWGQWLDHDLGLSPESEGGDSCQHNACDAGKSTAPPCFNLQRSGNQTCLPFVRSLATCPLNRVNAIVKREQVNVNTAFIDGSQIYGSTEALAKELRDKDGFLKITKTKSAGDLLPFDTSELMAPVSFCRSFGGCFLAGDTRCNEQQALAAMHTLFVREHNRIVRNLNTINPNWDGERKYQEARKIVGAILQKITYDDYLPLILGTNIPGKYKNYNARVNPGILNSFSTAAYRFGHSSIRPTFDLLDSNFDPISDPVPLRKLFFNNTLITRLGIDPLLLGLLGNSSEDIDRKLASDLLENLFERPNSPGLNLAALNIQRGRDHGLPGYNSFRRACGLSTAPTFYQTRGEIKDRKTREILTTLYNNNPAIADLWVAGLAEDPVNGGTIGPTFQCIIKKQLERVRDGDKFFYENDNVFNTEQLATIRKVSLSRVYCDNLKVVSIQRNAFLSGSNSVPRVSCDQIPKLDLTKWKEKNGTTTNDLVPGCPGAPQPTRTTVTPCRGRKCSGRRTRRQRIRIFRKIIRKITSRRHRRRRQRRH